MIWEELDSQFEIEIPPDEPVYPVNVVCDLLHMQYYLLHEIMREGVLRQRKKEKAKKLFSKKDLKVLRYVQYLIEEKGVNVKGVKVILEMREV
ncbi:MAG: MerR family transcriptional regulator [Candidatus Omnitrophica bacterium]|nr:MerR family transcriptional regulator [Candidatus Omnitrophota bacterium]MBU2265955.1 MerR family transcriptional regulator [Candidatus Omnitrophota bacterium]